jgi:hypothetical protein
MVAILMMSARSIAFVAVLAICGAGEIAVYLVTRTPGFALLGAMFLGLAALNYIARSRVKSSTERASVQTSLSSTTSTTLFIIVAFVAVVVTWALLALHR